ncbi:hypothetical protein SMD44_p10241 (plasmid) [Streptomyces alboflavus]|uniref:Uncharacterized protein n=1 Tax=Streptomyces alboflavus TaxID=67267 RepID=A0A291W369_9ACTN|nr:hypothetical protein [Streptomyces alboflavus]ATM24740.1 hypothetical protein SMD44_p10241 [Streptomyces alboflavus]
MTFIRTRNATAAATPLAPPTKDDGTTYVFEMIYDGGKWRGYADTPTELLVGLIPEYPELESPKERAAARIRLALRLQVQLQAVLATPEDLAQCTPEQQQAILAPRDTPPVLNHWDAPVPLVLVTTFYKPTGRLRRPTGPENSLLWIEPDDEWALLRSLAEIGVIHLGVDQDKLPPNVRGE